MKTDSIRITSKLGIRELTRQLDTILRRAPIKATAVEDIKPANQLERSTKSALQIVISGSHFVHGNWSVQLYADSIENGGTEIQLVALGSSIGMGMLQSMGGYESALAAGRSHISFSFSKKMMQEIATAVV
jgi:hypothetical protein